MATQFGSSGGMDLNGLIQALMGSMGQYSQFISHPTQSPLYRNQLSGLLAGLQPGEQKAQTNLMDMFRSAGNMASGAYGTASSQLQGDLQRNRQVTASNLLGQMFPQMTQALGQPMNIFSTLLQTLMAKQPSTGGGGGQTGEQPQLGEGGYDPWGFSIGPYPSHT